MQDVITGTPGVHTMQRKKLLLALFFQPTLLSDYCCLLVLRGFRFFNEAQLMMPSVSPLASLICIPILSNIFIIFIFFTFSLYLCYLLMDVFDQLTDPYETCAILIFTDYVIDF